MSFSPIKSPFTNVGIHFAVRHGVPADSFSLHPEEAAIHKEIASTRRREEFLAGRLAAHDALRAAGLKINASIDQGSRGEPHWPPGWCGSIAHTLTVAVAAVAPLNQDSGLRGVGVDIELAHRSIRPDLSRRICTENERRLLPEQADERSFDLIRIFSAKEAIYKAVYPILGQFLEFRDVELERFDTHGRASAHLILPGAPGGLSIQVCCGGGGGYLVTGAEVYSG